MYGNVQLRRMMSVVVAVLVIASMLVSCGSPTPPPPPQAAEPTQAPPPKEVEPTQAEQPKEPEPTQTEEPVPPKGYSEAPMLADKVKSGALPSVEQRLPEEPVVIQPIEEIGVYGGTIRVGTPNPSTYMDAWWITSLEGFLRIGPQASSWHPNVVKEWELANDAKSITLYLVKGIKWSDGEPFTVDDIAFWYNDVLQNKEITPAIAAGWTPGGELFKFVKVDDYTLKMEFTAPYPGIIKFLSHFDGTLPLYYPKHYLKDFHISYTDKDALQKKAEEAGFKNWAELFNSVTRHSIGVPLTPGLPTIQPFVLVEASSEKFKFERNPYYWKVDPEGNQLPYADGFEVVIVNSADVMTTKTISGEFDIASHTTNISNYSLYVENQEKGGYELRLWPQASFLFLQINQTDNDPELRKIFQDVRFRRALSLAMDREEMNQTVAYGLGKAEQVTVVPGSAYYDVENTKSYAQYDPAAANQLLDEMGLTAKDSEGFRLRPDNKRLAFTLELVEIGGSTPYAELMKEYFRAIGVDMTVKTISNELAQQRFPANETDASMWSAAGLTDQMFLLWPMWYAPIRTGWETVGWSAWARWYMTEGKEGEEPPEEIRELQNLFAQLQTTVDPEEGKKIGSKLMKLQAENLYSIGVVGYIPKPIVVKNRLHNVPAEGLWGWDTVLMYAYHPEQFFLK